MNDSYQRQRSSETWSCPGSLVNWQCCHVCCSLLDRLLVSVLFLMIRTSPMLSSLARGAVAFLRMLRLNESSYFHQNAVFCGGIDYPLNLAKRGAFFSGKCFTKNEPLGFCWNMVPKARIWVVFIIPTEQQDGCRVNRHVQRHLTDGFAGEPFCRGVQVSGCCMAGTWSAVRHAALCLVLPH